MIENSTIQTKVCHVTSAHPRYDVRIFHKECKSLASNNFDVTLIVNDDLQNETIDGVKILSTQMKPRNRVERIIQSKKRIRILMLEIDADIYHFHDPELLPEAVWIKNRGKKVIFDFHEDVSQQILFKMWIPASLRKIVSVIYKRYEQNKVTSFDALLTVTPKFVERLQEVNSNTVMITNYPILTDEDKNEHIQKKKAICFAGGISPQWNHENIINAIETIEGVEYILAGSGSNEYIEKLKRLEGWRKVRYVGRIPHEQVKMIYAESMVGMTLLSHDTQVGDEGTLGNTKIFEYMEARLPIICSNNKIWKDIAEEYKCGIAIDSNDVVKIAAAIQEITARLENVETMGANGNKAIKDKYNWSYMEERLIDLYFSILD